MMKNSTLLVSLAGFLFLAFINSGMALEEPKYKVVEKIEDIEIRQYESYLVAERDVTGEFEEAGNTAFSDLFDYISGENIGQEEIAMTIPVRQVPEGEKIAMTAPVRQENSGAGNYKVSFVMPLQYTMETIPQPLNENVKIREIPSKKMVVIQYSGTWSEENYEAHRKMLMDFIEERGLSVIGQPIWARYNSPFSLWFMRRNEIMIEIE